MAVWPIGLLGGECRDASGGPAAAGAAPA